MKCIRCGVWTRVLETRSQANTVDRRKRVCGNGHRFLTYEVTATIYHDGKKRLPGLERGVAARVERRKRDHQIMVLHREGKGPTEIGATVGVSEATVRYVTRRGAAN